MATDMRIVRCANPTCASQTELPLWALRAVDVRDQNAIDLIDSHVGWAVVEPLGLCCAVRGRRLNKVLTQA